MKTVFFLILIFITIPLGASAKMVSFDQSVFDSSTVSCTFTKSKTGNIEFVMTYGHGLSARKVSYVCGEKYTHWKDMIKYAKEIAKHLNKTDHIDPIKILSKIGLSDVREE